MAAGPATGWEGQPMQGPRIRKCPRCRRLASAPGRRHSTGRDATGRTGRGGGAAGAARESRERAPRAPAAARAQLSPGRGGGRRGRGTCQGSSATWASRDTGLSRHVTRERLRWGGLWPLLPALRKRNTERACAMGAWSAVSQSVRYWVFLFRNRRLGGKSFFAYLSLP